MATTRKTPSKKAIIGSIVLDTALLAANTTVGVLCITGRKKTDDLNIQFALGLAAGANIACASTIDLLFLGEDINRLIEYNKAEKAAAVETK